MGRGSARGSSPKKQGTRKAPAKRAASKRTARHKHTVKAAPSRRSSAKPKSRAGKLVAELKAAQARQAATSEILRIIRQSPSDVQPVFDAIVLAAVRLLGCDTAHFLRCDSATFFPVALAGPKGLLKPRQKTPVPVDPAANFASRVILSRKKLHLPDYSAIRLPPFEQWTREVRGINCALLLPLLHKDKCIAVLAIGSKRANHFSKADIALAESFRDQALIAIENARLFHETQAALERQTATSDVLRVIASSPSDVQPVFDAIAESAKRLLGSHSAVVTRVIDGMIQFAAGTAENEAAAHAAQGLLPYPLTSERIHARVARTGQLAANTDVANSDLPQNIKDFARTVGWRSMLVVPMLRNGIAIGTIGITRREAGAFDAKTIDLLKTFADQAVIAIENARLFNETREALERQTATAEILKVIASSPDDVQPVFDAIAKSARRLLGSHTAMVTRVIEGVVHFAAGTAESEAALHGMRGLFPYPLSSERIHGRVARTGQLAFNTDIQNSDRPDNVKELAHALGWRSLLVVPMQRDGVAIGSIGISRREAGPFDDRTIDLLKTFADQAVIAIENVRLFNETQEALERQTATADILKVIASSPDDVQPVFEAVVANANRLIGGFLTAAIRFIDGTAHLAAFTPLNPQADAILQAAFPAPAATFPLFKFAARGVPTQIEDTELFGEERLLAVSRARGFRSVLYAPLMNAGRPIGVIGVTRATPGSFAEHHVQLLQTFADQAVIAIENVRLFNETKEALAHQTATSEVLQAIGSSMADTQPVFERILDSVERLFDIRQCSIILARDGMMHLVARRGIDIEDTDRLFPAPITGTTGGEVIRTVRQIYVPSAASPQGSSLMRKVAELMGDYSVVMTPLVWEGQGIGIISAARAPNAVFSEKELALLRTFADQAVIAIENARLFNETQEALQRQTATADILKVIARSPDDVQPVFEAIVSNAARLIGAFSAGVYPFVDGIVHLAAITTTTPAGDAALRARFPRPIDDPFSATQDGEIVQVADTEDGARPRLRQVARERGFRSIVYVPLRSSGASIGAIAVSRKEAGPFAARHIELLQTFADQAVIAIENVRLFNETQESLARQTAMAQILEAINSSPGDLKPVFDAVLERAMRLCGAAFGALSLYIGNDTHRLVAMLGDQALSDQPEFADMFRNPMVLGPETGLGRLVRGEDFVHIADAADDEAYRRGNPVRRALVDIAGARTYLAVPIRRDDAILGSFTIYRREVRLFSPEMIALLKSFAAQAAIAIDNARLFNETKEALERQTATADILKVIASSPDNVQPVFQAIAERANKLVGGHATTVVRVVGDMLELAAFTKVSEEADAVLRASFPVPLTNSLVQLGEVSEISDTESEEFAHADIKELARARGFRARVLVPLKSDSGVIGAISATRVEPGRFDARHIQLLQTFADQAVIAIENVRLFEEVQARTRDLSEALQQQTATADVLKVISRSTFDLDAVLTTLTESAVGLCRAARGAVFLRDGDVLRVRANAGNAPEFIDFLNANPITPSRQTITGRAFLSGEIAQVPDVLADPDYEFGPAHEIGQFRAGLAVPLLRQGRVEGVFALSRPEPGGFTEREIELVQTFADQAVIAIENVRLFSEVQTRTKELATSLEDLRSAQDRLVQTEKLASLGQLTAGIAHEIKNPLNFVNNFSALSAELTDELNDLLARAELTGKMREEVGELTKLLKDNLEKVVQHGKRADSIVKNMLLHSRAGAGELRLSDINALVDESLNLAYHGARAERAGFNITLQRDFDAGAGSAELFPQEISRALLNLISNGFYAATKRKNENGGSEFEPMLQAATKDLGGSVEIRIRDNGTGIPTEVKEKMFNPFFTTKPAGEGTGLGLSMTHDIIVKQHGGRIDVETRPGEFTEFTIVLPRAGNPRPART